VFNCKNVSVHDKSLPKLLANMAKFIKIVEGLFLTKGLNAFSRYWVVSNVGYCAFWKLYLSWDEQIIFILEVCPSQDYNHLNMVNFM